MATIATTKDEIFELHRKGEAIVNQDYSDELGNVYRGTTDGNLKLIQQAAGVPFDPTEGSDLESGTVGEALEELEEKIEDGLDLKLDIVDFDAYKKEAKCFALAMAAAL
jgi:hypothetical protein